MKIAILSFGKLIKNAGTLVTGKWTNKNSVSLPIEFCRVSKSGALVPAISEESGVMNDVYYAKAKSGDLNKVIAAFMKKENIGENQIGIIDCQNKSASPKANKTPEVSRNIAKWCKVNGFHAVVFNALGRRFKDEINVPFSVQNAIKYVNGLKGEQKKRAVAAINSVPKSIETPFLTAYFQVKDKVVVKK